jgi:hypothetical protein
MSAHEAVAALPANANADHALIRAMAIRRFAYCLDLPAAESATAFVAVDPDTGTIPLYLIQSGTLFRYDSTDSTTAHDGVTCLVTSDGKRYKVSTVAFPYSVINSTTGAQPVSPSVGDMYRVPVAATGTNWSGQDNKIAIYTASGWIFKIAAVGQMLYDQATDTFWHLTTGGTWTAGFGAQALSAGAILPSNMSGGGGKVRWYVENQTTTAPPGSPTANVEYVVGPSATGAWSGKDTQIARYENGAWTYYVPAAGWSIYDKSNSTQYTFNGTSWISSAGAIIGNPLSVFTATGNTTYSGSGTYAYSATVAPTLTPNHLTDNATLTYTARKTGARLRFFYRYDDNSGNRHVIALFRDSETTALDWIRNGQNGVMGASVNLEIASNDALVHTYTAVLVDTNDGSVNLTLTRRRFSVEEFA